MSTESSDKQPETPAAEPPKSEEPAVKVDIKDLDVVSSVASIGSHVGAYSSAVNEVEVGKDDKPGEPR